MVEYDAECIIAWRTDLRTGQNEEAFIFRTRNSPRERQKSAWGYRNLNNTNNNFRRSSTQPRSFTGEWRKYTTTAVCHQCGKPGHIARHYRVSEPMVANCYQHKTNLVSAERFPTQSEIQNALHVLLVASKEKEWIINSGASKHFSGDHEKFTSLERSPEQQSVAKADGRTYSVKGKGDVHYLDSNDEIKLRNVLYDPGLTQNLLLVGYCVRNNNQILILGRITVWLSQIYIQEKCWYWGTGMQSTDCISWMLTTKLSYHYSAMKHRCY